MPVYVPEVRCLLCLEGEHQSLREAPGTFLVFSGSRDKVDLHPRQIPRDEKCLISPMGFLSDLVRNLKVPQIRGDDLTVKNDRRIFTFVLFIDSRSLSKLRQP
ncbi:unnamed protein product [Nesidiocoris tenuis]|uniref:Uncharacterized protein n=1 Tax=Nesidiocoris tenuis TaxID=355587 RepID=A0A6H5FVY1_9HEMI|nr:unnamed protein product [Nesidiocoris tenuis]